MNSLKGNQTKDIKKLQCWGRCASNVQSHWHVCVHVSVTAHACVSMCVSLYPRWMCVGGAGVIATQVFAKRLVLNQLRARGGAGERIVFGLMLVVLICNFSSVWAQRKNKPIRKQRQTTFQPDNAVLIYSSLVCLFPLLAPSPSIATSLSH